MTAAESGGRSLAELLGRDVPSPRARAAARAAAAEPALARVGWPLCEDGSPVLAGDVVCPVAAGRPDAPIAVEAVRFDRDGMCRLVEPVDRVATVYPGDRFRRATVAEMLDALIYDLSEDPHELAGAEGMLEAARLYATAIRDALGRDGAAR